MRRSHCQSDHVRIDRQDLHGQRDAFAAVLLERDPGDARLPELRRREGPGDADALWVTESGQPGEPRGHLQLPSVQAAIAKGRPMIAGFSNRVETVPVGGIGIAK
jgi:hypothetical protein